MNPPPGMSKMRSLACANSSSVPAKNSHAVIGFLQRLVSYCSMGHGVIRTSR